MKTGIIYYSNSQNIGDDIQTYAASKLVSNPIFIEREALHKITKNTPAIISGWFMTNPQNFPPSDALDPIFISFHGKPTIIHEKHYTYFKKHEPIGCRDYSTLKLFEAIGIKAYFSGCATLTLNASIKETERGDEIIIVDLLRKNYSADYRNTIKENLIPKEWKNKVSYFSHFDSSLPGKNVQERMQMVEKTLHRYAKAKLVITSLIHCALPCIAMGTPVLFIDFGFDKKEAKRDRFKGIIDLLNIYTHIEAPLAKRNFLHTSLRTLRLHHLLQHKIKPIPISYFENPLKNPSLNKDIIKTIKNNIEAFEKQRHAID